MPFHLSTDGVVTKCGLPVGELVLDGCTGDPDLFDCPQCEDSLGRPYAAEGAAESYGRGYDHRVVHHSVILEFDVPSFRTNAAQQRGQEEEVHRQK